jgi:hypothetical protein
MSRRFYSNNSFIDNLFKIVRLFPWKLVLVIAILIFVIVPIFNYGTHLGNSLLSSATNFFYTISGSAPEATPTPYPAFPSALPQPGSILYTIQAGDSCDSMLAYQMNMASAGQVFSDANPVTVKALSSTIGQDCDRLQPGLVVSLPPQYPLVALGGVVLKISATSPQQVIPTPLISVTRTAQSSVDCSNGCLLTMRIAPQTEIQLQVQTTLPVRVGSWVWAQAMMARKNVPNFPNYPYADPNASFNGMRLQACDLQVDNTHDDNALSCDSLTPNTIDDDGGAWLLGVVGSGGINHWHYPLKMPTGTRVMLWLTNNNGNLQFEKGNPVYRYDETKHIYVKA